MPALFSLPRVDEREAIEHYNRAGERAAAREGGLAPVRWPDFALTPDNAAQLVEGLLEARVDLAGAAFGPDFDSAAAGDALEIAWRTDALQLRFAPEGVFVRAAVTARVQLASGEHDADDESPAMEELVRVSAEICVSFTNRHHVRPFVDFMGGRWQRASDGASDAIDPFGCEIDPLTALAWGLNGSDHSE